MNHRINRMSLVILAIVLSSVPPLDAVQRNVDVEVISAWDSVEQVEKPAIRLADKRIVRMPGNVYRISRTFQFGASRVVAIGRSSNAEMVISIDPRSATIEDQFLAFAVSESPSQRFIVFERFYEPLGPSVRGVTMLYDLARSRQANRLKARDGFAAMKYVGFPVYPPEDAALSDYKDTPGANQTPQRLTNYYWLDSDELAFIEYADFRSHVIVVNGSDDFSRVTYERYPLRHEDVVRSSALGMGDVPARMFAGSTIKLDDAGRGIVVELPKRDEFSSRLIVIPR